MGLFITNHLTFIDAWVGIIVLHNWINCHMDVLISLGLQVPLKMGRLCIVLQSQMAISTCCIYVILAVRNRSQLVINILGII